MKEHFQITVLTPTYNRKEHLEKLYISLCKQTFQDFQWLIIDDGSTDGTGEYIKKLKSNFKINYYLKKNGGKHTALNYSHEYIYGDLVCIVDSDDCLIPHALKIILLDWAKYKYDSKISGLTYLRKQSNGQLASPIFPRDIQISNVIDFRLNLGIKGDCFEIIKANIFKSFIFPEYPDERFVPEGVLWNYVGSHYNTVYINKIIYLCEYLEKGLTKSGRLLRIENSKGCRDHCISYFEANEHIRIKKSILFKQAIFYAAYSKFSGYNKKETLKYFNNKYINNLYFIGMITYHIWKRKYRNEH